MAINATPAVSRRRLSQFYIQVPSSPIALSEYKPLSSCSINFSQRASGNLKENMPAHASLKRKPSLNADVPPVKKFKSDGHPVEYVYCHQCLKKRDIMATVQCTFIKRPSSVRPDAKGLRCTTKFCQSCLMNRYGENITQIKNGKCHGAKAVGHASDSSYVFKCPKCRDICNCSRCRKLKGLEPTGNLTNITRKAGASSAAHMLKENPNIEGIIPGKGNQVKSKPTTKDKGSTHLHSEPIKAFNHSSTTRISAPMWKRLDVPLDLCAIEDRIYIREFMLRFGKAMVPAINRNHLRELESIGGGFRGRDEFESWVSESCIKSMILGLLGFLVSELPNPEAIKSSMKKIRATGASLNKLWDPLQTLRVTPERITGCEQLYMTFPDPLPPPASVTVHRTRSMRSADNTINIVCSGQMVPVLMALIDLALATDVIRGEIETGLKEVKELSRKSKEAIRLENERWIKSRKVLETKTLEKGKNRVPGQQKRLREMHKQRLLDIDNSIEMISSNYAARFQGLLGKDREGRTYWTTSPGIEEIIVAHDFLTTVTCENSHEESGTARKRKKDQSGAEARPRNNFREWTWFVAVWGKPPAALECTDDSEDSDDEDSGEKWWIFDEASEIRKLANWLDDRDQANKHNDNLPKRLTDFANLLEWRGRVDRFALPLN